MKKYLHVLFISFALISFLGISQAQQTWVWTAYNVAIDLPDDFRVLNNNNNEFEANGDGMELYMYIFDADISFDEMKDATIEAAINMELEEVDVVQNILTDDFKGKYVAGYIDGDAVLLCGLIDPSSTTNFFAVITFGDDDLLAEEAAFDILESIRKNR